MTEKDLDSKQVQEFIDQLEQVVNKTKDEDLIQAGMDVLDDIKENQNAEENIILQKFQCLKCKEVFPTRQSFTGHYHGNPDCNGEPRWMDDFEDMEDQLNKVRI